MDEQAPESGQPTSENDSDNADQPPPPTKRHWWLAGLAWLLSLGAFFVPQRIPLEWYPLNEPGTDIHYLEIKCASDTDGWVTLWYDITHGWSDIDQIKFPVSPTEQTYTYTFPLPDAPMIGLRLDSVAKGGTLTVRHMRVINRRGEEVRNFPIESLEAVQGIASIQLLPPGWTVTSTADSVTPTVLIEPFPIIAPVGMTGRNIHRGMLSVGYLAGMLVILMLAVTSAFWRPTTLSDFAGHFLLLALIALPISAVGNRGLIKNTIRYATFDPSVRVAQPTLEITVQGDSPMMTQVFWDTGAGLSEVLSRSRDYVRAPDVQVLKYHLPDLPLLAIRFDPHVSSCSMNVLKIEVTGGLAQPTRTVALDRAFVVPDGNTSINRHDDQLRIETKPGIDDPFVFFTPEAIAQVNDAAAALRSPTPIRGSR